MHEDEAQRPTDARDDDEHRGADVEYRSLTYLGAQFVEGTVWGGGLTAGALGVQAAVDKIKDVRAPKDEGPKIELPPGVERE
jgi:hypothetical protein